LSATSTHTKWGAIFSVAVVVSVVGRGVCELVGTLIFTVFLVAARHNCQSQQVETEYECQNFFHRANVGKKIVGLAQNCRVALVRLGKIKCAAKVGRLMGGFAALFILRRDSQTALSKIALTVGLCL